MYQFHACFGSPAPVSTNQLFSSGLKLQLGLSRLRISQKITLGYVAALGIAIVGTSIGIIVGDRVYQQARQEAHHALGDIKQFQSLQNQILQIQADQRQLIPFVKQPQRFRAAHAQLYQHIADFDIFWANFEAAEKSAQTGNLHTRELPRFIVTARSTVNQYFENLEEIVLKLDQSYNQSSMQIEQAQSLMADFGNSAIALKLEDLSVELTQMIDLAYQELEAARTTEDKANSVRLMVIGLSMMGSIVVAAVLAFLINRAISHPIQATTHIAQRVTQADDFNLQAPVTTQDEIGALTTTLNELIQRVNQLLIERRESEAQLVHNEKMSSLGQLVAGIAHEINNPISFVHGNLNYAYDYAQDLMKLLRLYQTHFPHPPDAIQAEIEAVDLEFLMDDLAKLLQSMKVGTQRIQEIVLSLRTFSRVDESEFKESDIHAGIDSTLLILQHRLKAQPDRPAIQVAKHYGQLPLVQCYAGQLNQVFMNLLANAIDSLDESAKTQSGVAYSTPHASPVITIQTSITDDRSVTIRIADNGQGMSEAVYSHLFDPFFTTKPVGKGTGLGLSISYQIVVDKHNGKLLCNSTSGNGAEFVIQIPIHQSKSF